MMLDIMRVLQAQSGDRAAFDALLRCIQTDLFRYIRGLVGSDHLAEDVLQDVFVIIYRKLVWLRAPEFFKPWAYRIASREAFRRLKRERRRADGSQLEVQPEDLPAPNATQEPPELADHMSEVVACVSPASRAVLVLHYWHDLRLEEVADILGLPLGTVKSRLAYGLAVARRLVRDRTNSPA